MMLMYFDETGEMSQEEWDELVEAMEAAFDERIEKYRTVFVHTVDQLDDFLAPYIQFKEAIDEVDDESA